MKIGVVTFPGSNCDDDVIDCLKKTLPFEVNRLWHKDTPSLGDYILVVLPGGFSYGDYLRCGAMAACSPIMASIKEFANKGGLVIGICNGFQILCESSLLPGALARNLSLNFICKDVQLKIESVDNPWTNQTTKNQVLSLPIAHGEGRYIINDQEYDSLVSNSQILMTYQNNPNGSSHHIAGICNKNKNVFGLMPHPERSTDLRSRDGLIIWKSIKAYLGIAS